MRYLRQSNNQRIIVPDADTLGAGGEARVYAVTPGDHYAAKIYHRPTEAQARKLMVMRANPPDDPMSAQAHISIAWPIDLLRKMYGDQQFAGFLMPRVAGMRPLFNVYNPVTRRQECPLFNYLYLHRAARNVASAISALHNRGYVIGDVNESNILVSDTALVTLVDTDSFQVRDTQNGLVYRCPVGKPEFTPPELQGKNFRQVDRSQESDRFGLAVLIFQLLMEGTHPFSGIYQGEDDPPPYETRIRNGHYTYGSYGLNRLNRSNVSGSHGATDSIGSGESHSTEGAKSCPYKPMPFAPLIDLLHPTLRELFSRCFEDGHTHPELRPDASTWVGALMQAEAALITCPVNTQHRYGEHLGSHCPWCMRKEQLAGRDPFPLQPTKPYVRPGRDLRRVERAASVTIGLQGGITSVVITSSTSTPGSSSPTVIRAAVGTGASSNLPPQPAANLPNWPIAPSAFYAGSGPGRGLPSLPNYHPATWAAAIFCIPALLMPGFHLMLGLITMGCGVIALRTKEPGRWLAGILTLVGAVISLIILANAANRAFVLAELRTISEKGPVRSVAFSPDSTIIAAATERNEDQRLITGEAALFNTQTGDLVKRSVYPGDVASVTFSHDGRLFAAGSGALLEAGTVRIWDVRTWHVQQVLAGFKSDVESVDFSPDNSRIVTGNRDRSVEIWDVKTGAILRLLDGQGEVFSVAYSPDGKLVAAGSGSSGSGAPGCVSVWDAETGQRLWTHKGHSERCLSVAFSPDGKLLGSAGNDNTIRLWNPRAGNLERMLETHGVLVVNALAFSPDGKTIACGGNDGNARLWDLKSETITRTLTGQGATVQAVAFSPNGKLLACGCQNGVINVWRLH